MQLGVMASGAGTILQAVLDGFERGAIDGGIRLVLSNNSGAGALRRARAAGIPTVHISTRSHPAADARDRAITEALQHHQCDWVLLAGYMKRLGPRILSAYRGRIVNTHPSLLPRHGGAGFYGRKVHEAVIAAGDTTTGVSIHYVCGDYDSGPLIAQREIPVRATDDAASLEARVKRIEGEFVVETLAALARAV